MKDNVEKAVSGQGMAGKVVLQDNVEKAVSGQGMAGKVVLQDTTSFEPSTLAKEELDMRNDLHRRSEYLREELNKVHEAFSWLNSDDAKKQFRINDAMTKATARARD